jgi:outer membrane protein W
MSKSIIMTISLMFIVASAFAQQPVGSNAISVFAADSEIAWTQKSGTSFGTDFGAALEHQFGPRFSAELSVTNQHSSRFVTTVATNGSATTIGYSVRSYPVDATAAYHFFTGSHWHPYLGAGLRYVSESIRGTNFTNDYRFTTHTVEPEISGGITYQFTPRLGLRFDAKQVIGNGAVSDPQFRGSVGLSLRF